jgi:hypothetical protein
VSEQEMEGRSVQSPEQRRDALVERIFGSSIGFMEILSIYVGDLLGFYRALADEGGATASELADATGTHGRYTREWLEQQAVAGILEVESIDTEPEERRYLLPEGHDEVLLERDSLYFVAPFTQQMVSITRPLPAVLEAFRTGGGVPYPDYGEDMREGIAYVNRPMFVNSWGPSGCQPYLTSTSACRRTRPPWWPTSGAARGGRASRSPELTPRCGLTASTSTRIPSPKPRPTPRRMTLPSE